MWGDFLRNAAAQAQNIVGKVDELTSKGLEQATSLLETLDGLGDENENKDDSDEQGNEETLSEKTVSPKQIDDGEVISNRAGSGWGDDGMEFSDEEPAQQLQASKASLTKAHDTEHTNHSTSSLVEDAHFEQRLDYDGDHMTQNNSSEFGQEMLSPSEQSHVPESSTFDAASAIPQGKDEKYVVAESSTVTQEATHDQSSAREKKLQRAYKKLEKDKTKIQEELAKALSKNDSLDSELQNLKQTFLVSQKEWEDEREGLMQTIHEFQRIIHDGEAKRKQLEHSFAVSKDEESLLKQQVQDLTQLLHSTRVEYENMCDQYTELEQNGITELESVKKQLEDSLNEIQVLKAFQSQPETPRLIQSPLTAPFDVSLVTSLQNNIERLKAELESLRRGTFETTSDYQEEIGALRIAMDQKFQEVFSLKQSEIEADRNDLTQVRSELASALQKQQESEVNAMEWKCRCDQLTEKMQFLEEEHQKSHVELLTKHKTVLEQMKKFKQSYKNQEKQIKEIQEENEELKRNISVLQADSATNVEQLTIPAESSNVVPISSTIDVEKCQADLIETTNQLKCMTELLAATEEKYETAKVELGNVKAELVHHQNLIQSNDHYVQELKSCIVELQENIKTFEVETVQLIEKQAQLVAERNSFEGSLKYLNGLFQDQEAELTKLKESVALEKEQQTHQLDALIKKYDDKIQACETASSIELERLERMIREKEEEAEKLRSTIENISNSHPDVPADEPSVPQPSVDSAAIQMIQDESKSLRQQLDVLMNEKEALIQESKQLRASISELDYDMMELRQQQESQILQITTQHEAARGEFQETIDQIKGELESKNNMIEDDNRHIQSLQQEILEGSQRYQSKLLELEESIVQLTQEQGTLRDKVKVLEEQSEAKDRELLSKTEEIKRMMNLHEKEISRLQSAIEEAEAKLNSAYKERDRLQERVQTLETESTAEAQQLQDRQAELEESISQLTEEKEVFQEKVLFLQEQCQTKDRDLLLTMEDLENVTNNLMEVEKLKSEIEQDRLKIQQQLKDREEAFQRLEMQLQDSLDKQHTHKIQSEEIQEMKMTVEDLQREKEQWKGLVKEKTTVLEEYEQLNANLQRAINDFELQIFEQKQKMETFEEEKTTLSHKHQEDLWTLEEDLSLLRKELAIKDTTISKLRDEIALSTAKLNVTDQEQMKLIQDLASCQSALEEKIQRLEQLELDLSVSKIAHDQLTHQLGNQEKDNHNIRKSFEQFQQKYQLLEEQTQTLQMELSIKVEEINTLYSLNHDLQRQKELNIKQLQEQCNELNEMVSSLKDHDHEVTKERNHWQQKHQQVEQQMISMRNENQVLQEQISSMSELQQQYEELQENVKKMESKKKKDLEFLRKSNENISQLQHELNMWKQKYQDDVNQLNQQHDEDIKKLEEDMDSLTQTVCALTEERQGLQDQLAQSNTKSSSTPSEGSSFCMVNEVISPLTPSVTPLELHASDAESKVSIHVDATVEHQDNETNTGEYLESLLHEIISLKELIAQKEKEIMRREEETVKFQQTVASLQNKVHDMENHSNNIVKQNQQYQKDLKVLEESLLQSTMSIGVPSSLSNTSSTLPTQRQGRTPTNQSNNAAISSNSGDLILDLESASGVASPSPTMEKKDLAGTHVLMVKVWELIRIYYPALLHTIGERPPRVGAAGQAVAIYVFCLQFMAIYMFFSLRSCRADMV